MSCTRRVSLRISAFVEKYVSPLSAISRAVQAVYRNRKKIWHMTKHGYHVARESQAMADAIQAVRHVSQLPRTVYTALGARETRVVLAGSVTNFARSILPVMAYETIATIVEPDIQKKWPYLWVIKPVFAAYISYLFTRAVIPRLFLYPTLYNASLVPALTRDMQLAIAEEIQKMLEHDHSNKLNEIFLKSASIKQIGKFSKSLSEISYEIISRVLAKVFLEIFSEKEFISLIIKESESDIVFYDKLSDKFKAELTAEKIEKAIHRELSQFLSEEHYKREGDLTIQLAEEVKLKNFFDSLQIDIEPFLKMLSSSFVKDLWQHVHEESGSLKYFMHLLPSRNIFSRQVDGFMDRMGAFFLAPLGYLMSYREQVFIAYHWSLGGYLFAAILSGDLLLKQKTIALGLSKKETQEYCAQKKAYAFTLGMLLLLSTDLLSAGLSYIPGGNAWYVTLASYYLLSQFLSLNLILQPGLQQDKEQSFDLFYLSQKQAVLYLDEIRNVVVPSVKERLLMMQGPNVALLDVLNAPLTRDARSILIGDKKRYENMEEVLYDLASIPSFNIFLKLAGRDILDELKRYETSKQTTKFKILKTLLPVVSFLLGFVSEHLKDIVKLIGTENFNAVLESLATLIILAERHRDGVQVLKIMPLHNDFWDIAQDLESIVVKENELAPVQYEQKVNENFFTVEHPEMVASRETAKQIRQKLAMLKTTQIAEPAGFVRKASETKSPDGYEEVTYEKVFPRPASASHLAANSVFKREKSKKQKDLTKNIIMDYRPAS